MTKTVDNASPSAGGAVQYTVTITNNTSEAKTVDFTDTMDTGLTLVEGSMRVTGGTLNDGKITIAGKQSAAVTYSASVGSAVTGGTKLSNTAKATLDGKSYTASADVTVSAIRYVKTTFNLNSCFIGISKDQIPESYELHYVVTNDKLPSFRLEGVLKPSDGNCRETSNGTYPAYEWELTWDLPQACVDADACYWDGNAEILYGRCKIQLTEKNAAVEGYLSGFADSSGTALTNARTASSKGTGKDPDEQCDVAVWGTTYGHSTISCFTAYPIPYKAVHTYYDDVTKQVKNGEQTVQAFLSTGADAAVYSGEKAWPAVQKEAASYEGKKYICVGNPTDFIVTTANHLFQYTYVRAITVTWLDENGRQAGEVKTIPNGGELPDYPSDPSSTGKWGAPKKDPDGNITIQWEVPITVTFYPNGGSWEDQAASKEASIPKGTAVPANDVPAAPSHGDKTFGGWYTDPSGGTKVDPATATFDTDTKLYAHWTEPDPQEHTVTVHYVYANGGTASADKTETVEEGKDYSIPSPAIKDYTPDKPVVAGTMAKENVEVTVTYKKNITPVTYYTLTMR